MGFFRAFVLARFFVADGPAGGSGLPPFTRYVTNGFG
jgi:hypothetical protein